jgi:DNA polymerase-3 subunit gamma/tau
MSAANLTAKYRPRTFAEVAGQDAVKAILSRAAETGRVAPAYLFSGTRGVGKTTIARIFAKALNCEKAPTAEPCNQCAHCRQITAGVAPDVIEIDGASNRGIDDARRLKEDIGYAPIECRYKVFIIDEAHMLTREAFNALLKTLEEPPARVTFILATTEAHKFPATILSRCQHYAFKMLPQAAIAAHLEKILGLESVEYEPGAVQLIARRASGSVRDGMSLLGQALAFGESRLVEADVRGFLGLAGQDVFFALMEVLHDRDLPGVVGVLRQVLDQGLDLGFFLRELTGCWRNMFLLRQAGEAALPVLDLSAEEAAAWLDWAGRFEPAYIHACWQMTLEGQRRVLTSLEPALALELLLLNLASLPELLDLETLAPKAGNPAPARSGSTPPPRPAPAAPRGAPQSAPQAAPQNAPQATPRAEPAAALAAENVAPAAAPAGGATPTWQGFVEFLAAKNGQAESKIPGLRQMTGELEEGGLLIRCPEFQAERVAAPECLRVLTRFAREYFGRDMAVRVDRRVSAPHRTPGELEAEALEHPGVRKVLDSFQAKLLNVQPRRPG